MSAATAVMTGSTGLNKRAIALAAFYFTLAGVLLLLFAPGIQPGADTKFTLNLGSAPAIDAARRWWSPRPPSSTSWPAWPRSAARSS